MSFFGEVISNLTSPLVTDDFVSIIVASAKSLVSDDFRTIEVTEPFVISSIVIFIVEIASGITDAVAIVAWDEVLSLIHI